MKDITILTNEGIDIEKSLELFGDMDTYDQMLEDFLKDVDKKLEDARKFKETADMANYAIMVHSLKSDCKYFGIMDLADKFYEHEMAGKSNDFYFVTANFDELIKFAKHKINVLKKYMGVETNEIEETVPVSDKTILVVDDSNVIRNFIQKIFDGKYSVRLASDGEEAIGLIANTPHDKIVCVFLDLNMPNVDGFAVLDYFKNSNLFNTIPVSIITGVNDKESIDRAFSYPIVDMIQKPFNEIMIKNVVEKTVAQKH
jgi:CheY-like chemotaxis protein